jgi:hypothetical protein
MLALTLLASFSSSTCESVTHRNDGNRIKHSSVDDATWPSCLIVLFCVFVDIDASLLDPRTFGGAICLELEGSIGNRIEDCFFVQCSVWHLSKPRYGGAFAVIADTINIARCCANDCHAQRGQFTRIDGASVCDISEIGVLSCGTAGDIGITGALELGSFVAPTVINANFTSCYCEEDGAAINFLGSSGSSSCRFFTVWKCNGFSAINGERTFSLRAGNLVTNTVSSGVISWSVGYLSLDHCHFSGNSNKMLKSGAGGSFQILNCHLRAELPGSLTYVLTSNNKVAADAPTLPICHLSTSVCRRQLPCASFTFTLSAAFEKTSEFSRERELGLGLDERRNRRIEFHH